MMDRRPYAALRERNPLMLLKCVFLFTFLPTVPCFRSVPDFRTEQVRGGFTLLLVLFLVACESIRFFRLKFLRVKLETWAEKTGCSRRLSFWLPDRFSTVNYATPAPPLPLPSAPLLKKNSTSKIPIRSGGRRTARHFVLWLCYRYNHLSIYIWFSYLFSE